MRNPFGTAVRRSATALLVAGVGFVGSASAVLIDRGPELVYDTVLDITWTRQAGDGVGRSWVDSVAWAAALDFGGFNDWRLPWASVSAGAGPTNIVVNCGTATELQCRDNEMGYMFYYNLDGDLGDDKTGTVTAAGGEMLTGIAPFYWSGTDFNGFFQWSFFFVTGNQAPDGLLSELSAWAVRPGDVGVAGVPEPATLTLLGVALAAFGSSRRRKKT